MDLERGESLSLHRFSMIFSVFWVILEEDFLVYRVLCRLGVLVLELCIHYPLSVFALSLAFIKRLLRFIFVGSKMVFTFSSQCALVEGKQILDGGLL